MGHWTQLTAEYPDYQIITKIAKNDINELKACLSTKTFTSYPLFAGKAFDPQWKQLNPTLYQWIQNNFSDINLDNPEKSTTSHHKFEVRTPSFFEYQCWLRILKKVHFETKSTAISPIHGYINNQGQLERVAIEKLAYLTTGEAFEASPLNFVHDLYRISPSCSLQINEDFPEGFYRLSNTHQLCEYNPIGNNLSDAAGFTLFKTLEQDFTRLSDLELPNYTKKALETEIIQRYA